MIFVNITLAQTAVAVDGDHIFEKMNQLLSLLLSINYSFKKNQIFSCRILTAINFFYPQQASFVTKLMTPHNREVPKTPSKVLWDHPDSKGDETLHKLFDKELKFKREDITGFEQPVSVFN